MKSFLLVLTLSFFISNLFAKDKLADIHATIISVNQKSYLAVGLKNQKDWHTYWINPGEAGLATKIEFFLTDNDTPIQIAEDKFVRPAPVKFSEGANSEVVIYGHKNEHIFYYNLDAFKPYFNSEILIRGTWLICKEICVNEQLELKGIITPKSFKFTTPITFSLTNDEYNTHFKQAPSESDLPKELTLFLSAFPNEKKLVLHYEYSLNTEIPMNAKNRAALIDYFKENNLLYPYPLIPFGFKRERLYVNANQPHTLFGQVEIDWDGEYQDPPIAIPNNGTFVKPYNFKFLLNPIRLKDNSIEVLQPLTIEFPLQSFSLNPNNEVSKALIELGDSVKTASISDKKEYSIFMYYLLALLGGLILNFMPCVLPVISIKLFELIRSVSADKQKTKKRIFEHNLFYSIGVLFCFQILALVIVLIKQQGENASWGFQLQNPYFVTVMIFVLFIFSLNLFGLFEFGTPFGNKIGNVKIPSHIGGDFMGGVLTTILSTPCSAPFLGSALTFAFFSPTIHIFGIFFTIGLGLSFPFLVTGIFPQLVSLLPRPGKWMLTIKKVMGVSLILTVIWLFDIIYSLVAVQNFYIGLYASLSLILCYFLVKSKWIKMLLALLVIGSTLFAFTKIESFRESSDLIDRKKAKGLAWEKWSTDKMEEYKKSQDLVFFDFTAKWCFNCKINEKLVLETDDFKKLIKEHNLKLLLADWTNHDDKISNFLNSFKIVGVPAYFIQKKDGTLISLGETITINKISEALKTK